jgi:hypothetical protein
MTEDQMRQQTACFDWMLKHADHFTHALTLTLKPTRVIQTDVGQTYERLTQIEAKRAFGFFLTRLNARLYGHAAKRHGKSVAVIPVLEGAATNKLLHYHYAMGNFRTDMSQKAVEDAIGATWQQCPFANKQIAVRPLSNEGWFAYTSKEIGIKNADVFDWENVRLPAASLV